jgi:hypothetical protein
MAGIKQLAVKSVQAKQIEEFYAFRRKLGKTQKFRRFHLSAPRSVLSNAPSKPPCRRLHNTKEKHMSKPTHIAYVVKEVTKDGKKKSYWRKVGAVWPHKNGEGFDVVIHDQISVSGRITCTVPREDDAAEEAAPAEE